MATDYDGQDWAREQKSINSVLVLLVSKLYNDFTCEAFLPYFGFIDSLDQKRIILFYYFFIYRVSQTIRVGFTKLAIFKTSF